MHSLFVIFLCFSNSILGLETPEDAILLELRRNLFNTSRYEKLTPPATQPLFYVQIKLHILHIYRIHEAAGVLSINGYLQVSWNDARLRWQPINYGNCTNLAVPQESVWIPEIFLLNDAAMKHMDKYGSSLMAISYKGRVYLDVPTTFHSTCEIDHKFYPFDKHTCAVEYSFWSEESYYYLQLLKLSTEKDILDNFSAENPEWKIVYREEKIINRTYACCTSEVSIYKVEIRVERQLPQNTLLLIAPIVISVLITLSIFWIPIEQHGYLKITLAGLVIFVLVTLISFLGWRIPSGGKSTPLIVVFCGNTLIMASVSIVATIATLKISRRSHKPIPPIVQTVAKIILGNCKRHDLHVLNDLQVENETSNEETNGWMFINAAFDRICFFIYVCVFIYLLCYCFNSN